MLIQVTQEDIDRGIFGSTTYCPVALACKRAGLRNIEVSTFGVFIGSQRETYLRLPTAARNWIIQYDTSHAVEPITFDLPLKHEKSVKV